MQIVWLGQPDCHDPARVGGKAANLSRLAATYPVPPGFCLTATSAQHHPRQIYAAAIDEAYAQLARLAGMSEPRVAVRSSAVDEDGARASFAGQHETFLNVCGPTAIRDAVMRCFHSALAPRAMAYRRQNGLSTDHIRLAVLVQHLVNADTSAVIFSANPMTCSRDEVVITANWGLGESIVGGTVTPDTFLVRGATVEARPSDKERMTVAVDSGVREVPVPRLLRRQPTLTDAQAREMADLARSLEATTGYPVDVECAWKASRLYLLQCRPITTLSAA